MPTLLLQVKANASQSIATFKQLATQAGASVKELENRVNTHATGIVNHLFRIGRMLARIRTGFFILVTFLALRPIYQFFVDAFESSIEFYYVVENIKETWREFQKIVLATFGDLIVSGITKFTRLIVELAYWITYAVQGLMRFADFIGNMKDLLSNGGWMLGFIIFCKALNDGILGLYLAFYDQWGRQLRLFIYEIFSWLKQQFYMFAFWIAGWVYELVNKLGGWFAISVESYTAFINTIKAGQESALSESSAYIKEQAAIIDKAYKGPIANLTNAWKLLVAFIQAAWKPSPYMEKVNAQFETTRLQIIELQKSLKEMGKVDSTKLLSGVYAGLRKHMTNMTKLGEELGDALASGMETALSDTFMMLMEGKFNQLKNIVASFLKSIQKAIADFWAKKLVSDLIAFLVGTGTSGALGLIGGIGTGGGDLSAPAGSPGSTTVAAEGFAAGGVINSPRYAYAGDSPGGEAFVPLAHGKIPVSMKGAKSSGPTIVNNITFAPQVIDGPSFSQWMIREKETIKGVMLDAAGGSDARVRRVFKIGEEA